MSKDVEARIKIIGSLDPSVKAATQEARKQVEGMTKDATAQARNLKTGLAQVNSALKLNPTSTELITQKQAYLGQAVSTTEAKLVAQQKAYSKLRQEALINGKDNREEQMRLQREIQRTITELDGLKRAQGEAASMFGMKMQGVGQKLGVVSQKTGKIGRDLMKVSGPAIAVAGYSAKMAVGFDENFAKINTIVDASGEHFKGGMGEMKKQIMNFSSEVGVASADYAQAVYDAISAGQKVNDAPKAVADATKLAKAGFTDQATALDVLTTVQNAYGKATVGTFENISDKLIKTQNLGKVTVGELAASIGTLVPTAKSYGVSLDNVSAGYAVLTKNGIESKKATTYMNSMFDELGKSSSKVSKILKDETGQSFDELMASGKTVGEVLQILQGHCDKTGDKFTDLWSKANARKAANSILDHKDEFADFYGQMANSAGTLEKAYATMEETTAEKLQKMKVNLQNIAVALGGPIVQALEPIVQKVADVAGKFVTAFNKMSPATQNFVAKTLLAAAAAGPLMLGVSKVTGALSPMFTVLGKGASHLKVFAGGMKGLSGVSKLAGGFKALSGVLGIGGKIALVAAAIAGVAVATGLAVKGVKKLHRHMADKKTAGKAVQKKYDDYAKAMQGLKDGTVTKAQAEAAKKSYESSQAAYKKQYKKEFKVKPKAVVEEAKAKETKKKAAADKPTKADKAASKERIKADKEAAKSAKQVSKLRQKETKAAGKAELQQIKASQKAQKAAAKEAEKIAKERAKSAQKIAKAQEKAAKAETKKTQKTSFKDTLTKAIQSKKPQTVKMKVDVNTTAANKKLQSLSKAASRVTRSLGKGKAKININTTKATSSLKKLASQVKKTTSSISTQKIKLGKVDTKPALTQVKTMVKQIKAALNSIQKMRWSIPKPRVPKISVSGRMDANANPPTVPKFTVHYKSAMQHGTILDSPTIFGMMNGHYLGAGEAGPEAVVGAKSLSGMVHDSAMLASRDLLQEIDNRRVVDYHKQRIPYEAMRRRSVDGERHVHIGSFNVQPTINVPQSAVDGKGQIDFAAQFDECLPEIADKIRELLEDVAVREYAR